MSRRSLIALTGLETRRLLLHPLVLAGLALSFVVVAVGQGDVGQVQSMMLMGLAVLPFALGTFAAANLAALSSTRAGVDELLDTLPQGPRVRTAAQLLAVVVAVPVAVAVMAAAFLLFDAGGGLIVDVTGVRRVPVLVELAQGPVLVLALGAVGVLLGRIAPMVLLGAVLVIVIAVAEVPLVMWTPGTEWRWVVPLANDMVPEPASWRPCEPTGDQYCTGIDRFDTAGMGWHLVGLAGVAIAAAVAALRFSSRSS